MKKILAGLVAVVMALSMIAIPVAAESVRGERKEQTIASGTDTEFIGYITYDPAGYLYWGSFTESDPSNVTNLGYATDTCAAASAGNTIYGFNHSDGDTSYYVMDGDAMVPSYVGTDAGQTLVLAMAFDYTTETMYALASPDGYGFERNLYTVDRATGELNFVGYFELEDYGFFQTLAIDNNGVGYGIEYRSGDLYTIDLETAQCEKVGNTGLTIDCIQSMTWDMNTNRLFWAHYNITDCGTLYIVDPQTAQVTSCGTIGNGSEVCALLTLNDIEVSNPFADELTVTFVDGFIGDVIDTMTVVPGTVLTEDDFPEYCEYEGYEFIAWDYDGMPIYQDTVIIARYLDPYVTSWYFELNPIYQGWTFMDNDGDGYNWNWKYDSHLSAYEGLGLMFSLSFTTDIGPLTPDNWMVTPNVWGGGSLSFYMSGNDGDWYREPVGIYVSTDNGESWSDELAYFVPSGEYYEQCTVDLSAYDGMQIKIGFRHYNVTNLLGVKIDEVVVVPGEPGEIITEPPTEPPVEPTEPAVEPTQPPEIPPETQEPTQPVEPTEVPSEPVESPTPSVPTTGTVSLVGVGIISLIAGAAITFGKRR